MYWGPIFLLHNALRATNLDKKCWEFCTALPTERISRGYGSAMALPLATPWSKLFCRDQKWSSRTSTFLGGEKGGVFVVARALKSFILKLELATSTFLNIFVQDWTLCTVSVKIVGSLYCLLALPMLVCKIWWVRRARRKQTAMGGSVPTIFVSLRL